MRARTRPSCSRMTSLCQPCRHEVEFPNTSLSVVFDRLRIISSGGAADTLREISDLTKPPIEPISYNPRRASSDSSEAKRGLAATMSYAAANTATFAGRAASR
jgi:hypothetical protein